MQPNDERYRAKMESLYYGVCEKQFFNLLALSAFRLMVDEKPMEERKRIIDGVFKSWEEIIGVIDSNKKLVPDEKQRAVIERLRKRFEKLFEERII
jgi:hypothetical protein